MANDDEARDHDKDSSKSTKGELKEALGAVTGDRHVEAEGRVEQKVADPRASESEESDETVRNEEQAVRGTHRDIPAGGREDSAPLGT